MRRIRTYSTFLKYINVRRLLLAFDHHSTILYESCKTRSTVLRRKWKRTQSLLSSQFYCYKLQLAVNFNDWDLTAKLIELTGTISANSPGYSCLEKCTLWGDIFMLIDKTGQVKWMSTMRGYLHVNWQDWARYNGRVWWKKSSSMSSKGSLLEFQATFIFCTFKLKKPLHSKMMLKKPVACTREQRWLLLAMHT